MRICVIGAGAIGGFVGARFAFAGHEVSLVARGAHLRAIRERGLTLIEADGREHVAKVAHATDDISTLGQQDVVIPVGSTTCRAASDRLGSDCGGVPGLIGGGFTLARLLQLGPLQRLDLAADLQRPIRQRSQRHARRLRIVQLAGHRQPELLQQIKVGATLGSVRNRLDRGRGRGVGGSHGAKTSHSQTSETKENRPRIYGLYAKGEPTTVG